MSNLFMLGNFCHHDKNDKGGMGKLGNNFYKDENKETFHTLTTSLDFLT